MAWKTTFFQSCAEQFWTDGFAVATFGVLNVVGVADTGLQLFIFPLDAAIHDPAAQRVGFLP